MKIITLSDFCKELVDRTDKDFDCIVIIESGSVKGTGKSVFTLNCDMEISRQKGFRFDLNDMVVFDATNEKVVDMVRMRPGGWPIHVDEASKVAYKRNWSKDEQKDLIIFINVCRKFHKIILINNPTFWGLDKDLLDLADYRVTILKRGLAIVRGKSKNPESKDKWFRDWTDEMVAKASKNQMDVDEIINALRKTPNYLYEIRFPPIDQKIYSVYEQMSRENELKNFYANQRDDGYHTYFDTMLVLFKYATSNNPNLKWSWRSLANAINWVAEKKGKRAAWSSHKLEVRLHDFDGFDRSELIGQVFQNTNNTNVVNNDDSGGRAPEGAEASVSELYRREP